MKKCSKCGIEFENEMFYVNNKNADGLDNYCKECRKATNKLNVQNRRNKEKESSDSNTLLKVYSNPELAKFTPRQLMQELKARGFKWEYMLEPQKKVMYDKI